MNAAGSLFWWGCAGLLGIATACGSAPVSEVAPPAESEPSTLASARPAASTMRSAPVEYESACTRAMRWVAQAQQLAAEGWVRRPLRLLEHAKRGCASVSIEPLATALKPEALPGALPVLVPRPTGAVVGIDEGAAAVWVAEPDGFATVDGQTGRVTSMLASGAGVAHVDRAGGSLLTVDREGLRVWSSALRTVQHTLRRTDETYEWAAFVEGGAKVVAVGNTSRKTVVRVFDVRTANNVGAVQLPRRKLDAALMDDKRLVVSTTDDVVVVGLDKASVIHTLSPLARAGDRRVQSHAVAVAAAPTGTVAAGLRSGRLLVWQLPQARPVADIDTKRRRLEVALSRDGQRLIVGLDAAFKGEVRTIDIATAKPLKSYPLPAADFRLAPHGTHVAVMQRGELRLFDNRGRDRWPRQPRAAKIEAAALDRTLAITEDVWADRDHRFRLYAWRRGQYRRFDANGYRHDVIAVSPSGRYAAAVLSRKGLWVDMTTGSAESFDVAQGRGFPDTLVFRDEKRLRLGFERPATAWSAHYPFGEWKEEIGARDIDGFRGTALSATGVLVAREKGQLVSVSPNKVLIERDLAGFAFSGAGGTLFAGAGNTLVWFNSAGEKIDEHQLPCVPSPLGVDGPGTIAAFGCGENLVRYAASGVMSAPVADIDAVAVSGTGNLIAVRSDARVRLYDETLQLRATVRLFDGAPVVTAPDGRLMFWAMPAWASSVSCRVGTRVTPFDKACADRLLDDTLVDDLLGR
ncbi:MAG: hypothetical protein AAGA56_02320 [Myxococcota bacterium]